MYIVVVEIKNSCVYVCRCSLSHVVVLLLCCSNLRTYNNEVILATLLTYWLINALRNFSKQLQKYQRSNKKYRLGTK